MFGMSQNSEMIWLRCEVCAKRRRTGHDSAHAGGSEVKFSVDPEACESEDRSESDVVLPESYEGEAQGSPPE